MPAQIRPNRLEVSDRFPMLGFTIRTDGSPRRAEVVIAVDPALFRPDQKARRNTGNFYSSRAGAPLMVPRGEAIYMVPPEVLARFIGQDRLYFALATTPEQSGAAPQVDAMPGEGSPYVSLKGLTGRSLRRVRLLPSRQQRAAGYGTEIQSTLEWAGDRAVPGMEKAPPASSSPEVSAGTAPGGSAGGAPPPAPIEYNDGFGPLEPGTPPREKSAPAAPAAQALDLSGLVIGAERTPVRAPSVTRLEPWQAALVEAAVSGLAGPFAPLIAALPAAARAGGVSIGVGPAVGAGLGAGVGLGTGVVFGPDGGIGVYGAAEFQVGFLASISATAQITIVRGGIESFNGWGLAVAISGGEGIVGGASALFDLSGNFQGVSFQLGIGVGLTPVDFYIAVQRQVAAQLGMAAALGELPRYAEAAAYSRPPVWPAVRATVRSLGADPLVVDIKYRMFIPSPLIDSPTAVFGGDGRGFSYDGGTSRGELHAAVRLTPGGGIDSITVLDRHWGESTEYNSSDAYHVESKPDWWLEKVEGAQPINRATLQVGDDNLKIRTGAAGTRRNVQAVAEQASLISIEASGALPLSSVAPAIDADMSLYLRINNGSVEVKVDGEHDGFPAHELYVNGQRVYSYDPVAAGSSPSSLLPPMDITASTGWIAVATLAAAQGVGAGRPVRAFSGEIPLDPGIGGMSIGPDALEAGDIILSTTDATVSGLIRFGTSGKVSHAMLYVGQGGQVVEAIGSGVVLRPLAGALADATVAVAFRVPGLTDVQRRIVADKAAEYIGRAYDYVGIARQAVFQIDQRLCNALPNGAAASCRTFTGRIDLGTTSNDTFFCSELVLEAYRAAGHPLTTEPPHWAAPQDLANLAFNFGKLLYIGHLKAPALAQTGFFGHLFTQAQAAGGGVRPRLARAQDLPENLQNLIVSSLLQEVPAPEVMELGNALTNPLVAGALASLPDSLRNLLDRIKALGWSVAFGTSADVATVSGGYGVAFGTDGMVALYAYAGAQLDLRKIVGQILSALEADLALQYMVLDGPVQSLRNLRFAAGITLGEDVIVGAHTLFDAHRSLIGVSAKLGIGAALRVGDLFGAVRAAALPASQGLAAAGVGIDRASVIFRAQRIGGEFAARMQELLDRGVAPSEVSPLLDVLESPRLPLPQSAGYGVRAFESAATVPAAVRSRESGNAERIRWDLERLAGFMAPASIPPVDRAKLAIRRTELGDWPYIPAPDGDTSLPLTVAWAAEPAARAVGDITVLPGEGRAAAGWSLSVTAAIGVGAERAGVMEVPLVVRYTFSAASQPDILAITELVLRSDGTFDRHDRWEAPMRAAA